jgi:membrane protease YdiL (CAAX protease family)
MYKVIDTTIAVSDRRRIFEISAVIFTGIGKLVFINLLRMHFVYIVSASLFWTLYVIWRVSHHRKLIAYWGLSLSNAKKSFQITGIACVIAVLLMTAYGIWNHTIHLTWNLLFVLVTYPVWGLVQQFLLMSLLAGNLKDFQGRRFPSFIVVVVTSVLFSIVHYPYPSLIVATFLLALFYSILFLKERNIIPLGIFHGILGGLFFYFILGIDTWKIFVKYFQ